MSVNVRLFGAFEVTRDGDAAEFSTRPTASLCAFLAAHSDRPVNRYVAAEAVWPEDGSFNTEPQYSERRSSTPVRRWNLGARSRLRVPISG